MNISVSCNLVEPTPLHNNLFFFKFHSRNAISKPLHVSTSIAKAVFSPPPPDLPFHTSNNQNITHHQSASERCTRSVHSATETRYPTPRRLMPPVHRTRSPNAALHHTSTRPELAEIRLGTGGGGGAGPPPPRSSLDEVYADTPHSVLRLH